MITVEQRPLTLTPVNVEHVYTFSSTNSGNQDFRYVVDVYQDATTTNSEKVARLFIAPNTYAKGILNLDSVVSNLVEGNARSEQPQYTSATTTGTTAYGLISNVKGLSTSNAFNDNINYNKQVHVRDYRVIVGEQWTSGNTTVTYISTDSTIPGSTFYVEILTKASSQSVGWYGAGANLNQGSSYTQGITWEHTTQMGGFIASGTSVDIDGVLSGILLGANDGDFLDVVETYSGIKYRYTWTSLGEGDGWFYIGVYYDNVISDAVLSPPSVTIWPGTSLKEGSYNPYVYNTPYWDTTTPSEQQDFWEVKKYRMSGQTINEAEPSLFLTTAGPQLYNFYDDTTGDVVRARRRRHHPSCPIVVSYFNGVLSKNSNFDFENPLESVYALFSQSQNTYYQFTSNSEYNNGIQYTGLTPQNDRIKYITQIRPDLAGGKIGFYAGQSGDFGQWDQGGYSEFLEYYLEEDDCLSDPIHVMFLNRQGVWDTYTLDRKALETKVVERDIYAKGGISDTNMYSQLSTNRRKTIYNQTITESMNVNTWFLTDNDKPILEDLFMSPEVYIIKEHDWTDKDEKTYNPYLLPVVVNMNSLQEYKNIYNKSVQYEFVLEYTPINQYNTQG